MVWAKDNLRRPTPIFDARSGDYQMAKRTVVSKESAPKPNEDKFIELMLVAADFVRNSGGMDQAKKGLTDAGQFIQRAGSLENANKALEVLENLKNKIAD